MRMRYILISLWVIDKTYQTYTVIAKLFLSFFYEQNMRGQLRKKNYLKTLTLKARTNLHFLELFPSRLSYLPSTNIKKVRINTLEME